MKFDRIEHWKDPDSDSAEIRAINDGRLHRYSLAKFYLNLNVGEKMMRSVEHRFPNKDAAILEFGCNTGRCLAALHRMGYKNLTGIELSQKAIDLGRKSFPDEMKHIFIINAALEDVVKTLPQFQVIYGVGVLMHIPHEFDWVVPELVSKSDYLFMTSENEEDEDGYFKWARNYKNVIEPLGWAQVEEERGDKYPPYLRSTIKRVFIKDERDTNNYE